MQSLTALLRQLAKLQARTGAGASVWTFFAGLCRLEDLPEKERAKIPTPEQWAAMRVDDVEQTLERLKAETNADGAGGVSHGK